MSLYYASTRDHSQRATASEAILKGLADDGGLYAPHHYPTLPFSLDEATNWSYQEIATEVLAAWLPDFTIQEIKACVTQAYGNNFEDQAIAPVRMVEDVAVLELFHGPTLAFKDLALTILPHLLTTAARKQKVEREIVILTATSGDTGKAAMEGFEDVPGTSIIVFYPTTGVSPFQKRQMTTQTGENTFVVGIDGNFDDAQTAVKQMFHDEQLRTDLAEQGFQFSSANSMNIGRLVPQIAYYVAAYIQLLRQGTLTAGELLDVAVPTGNFGNILAAYYAKQMGLPLGRFICASNQNHVLTDFFSSGTYDRQRPFYVTTSPSMDILVSSNLERLIYHATGNSDTATKQFMEDLQTKGHYALTPTMQQELVSFYAGFASESETAIEIERVAQNAGYIEDPHTAVASKVLHDYLSTQKDQADHQLLVATASPYKFPEAVLAALKHDTTGSESEQLNRLAEIIGETLPEKVAQVLVAPVRHQTEITTTEMETTVRTFLTSKKQETL